VFFQDAPTTISCCNGRSAPYGAQHNRTALLFVDRLSSESDPGHDGDSLDGEGLDNSWRGRYAGPLSARLAPTEDVEEGHDAPAPLTAEAIFQQYARRIYNLARRLLANEADVEDVTQDVLLQVVRKLDTFRGEADIATWLHRVTVNAALVHRRKSAPRLAREASASAKHLEEKGRAVSFSSLWVAAPDRQLIDQETRALIERAVRDLPEKYREPFVLSDREGLSNAAIGGLLGLSLPAVKSRLHRARRLLRDALKPYFEEFLAPAVPAAEAVARAQAGRRQCPAIPDAFPPPAEAVTGLNLRFPPNRPSSRQ
jgi:RNA polymerase sigma-70 factor (ECF subfamily)